MELTGPHQDPPAGTAPVRIGLALGGGAVRGAAHIGVLNILDKAGLAPSIITGCSAGALVGALYAGGMSAPDISALARTLHWKRLVRPSITGRSLFETARLGTFLDKTLDGRTFADLELPFATVACELTTARRVVLDEGPVSSAVLASSAIPGVFPPVERDGMLLVDGSLVDMVPAALARTMGADIVVAVDVSGPLPRRPPKTMVQIMVAVSTLQPGVEEHLARDADLVLTPDVDAYAFWELSRMSEFEQAGAAAAEESLPLVQALVQVAEARTAWERRGTGAPATGPEPSSPGRRILRGICGLAP